MVTRILTARRSACSVLTALLAIACVSNVTSPAVAQDERERRVIVVTEQGETLDVPIESDEHVEAVTGVRIAGEQVVLLRVAPMPEKPDFTIITPANIVFPFKNGPVAGLEHITATHYPVFATDPAGTGQYIVRTVEERPGGFAVRNWHAPPGARFEPDPPQPAGTYFYCLDAVPATSEERSSVLEALGLPADDTSEVQWVPSGTLYFGHDTWTEPETVVIDGPYDDVESATYPNEVAEWPANDGNGTTQPPDLCSPLGLGAVPLSIIALAGLKRANRR
jgi:hypothetical protein